MKASANIKLTGALIIFAMGLAACSKPGLAETAGKKIDLAASEASQQISDSADKVAEKISKENNKAGVAIDDTEITAKVKAAFFSESGLKTLQISVVTVKGVVVLSGSVDSLANKEMAQSLAGAVAGVSKVKNLLVLKSIN